MYSILEPSQVLPARSSYAITPRIFHLPMPHKPSMLGSYSDLTLLINKLIPSGDIQQSETSCSRGQHFSTTPFRLLRHSTTRHFSISGSPGLWLSPDPCFKEIRPELMELWPNSFWQTYQEDDFFRRRHPRHHANR